MKVVISWSGYRSKAVAEALQSWLRAAAAGWLASRTMQRAEVANQGDETLVTLVAEQ